MAGMNTIHYVSFVHRETKAEHSLMFNDENAPEGAPASEDMVYDLADAIASSVAFTNVRVRVPTFDTVYGEDT